MGIYLLNISVDTKDPHPEYIPEDLSINDQESIVEIVVEKILGFENAIQEKEFENWVVGFWEQSQPKLSLSNLQKEKNLSRLWNPINNWLQRSRLSSSKNLICL